MTLSIVIPAYNEAESLPRLFQEITEVCEGLDIAYEVLVVDDGSRDGTFEVVELESARDSRIRGIRFRRNCGKAAALSEGFQRCRGEFIVTLDADLQDNPAEIPDILQRLRAGADLVSGWKKKRYDPLHKTLPSKFFNAVTSQVAGLKLHDFNCGLKGYRREVVEDLALYGELHRYIPVLAHWNGFKVEEKVVEHRPRKFGQSKYGLSRLSNGMFDLITLIFLHRYTRRPLHLFGFVGLLFTLLGFSILSFFALDWVVTGALHVRPLMLGGVASVIVGIQFISFGLLGEMLNHRFSDLRYPVASETGGGGGLADASQSPFARPASHDAIHPISPEQAS